MEPRMAFKPIYKLSDIEDVLSYRVFLAVASKTMASRQTSAQLRVSLLASIKKIALYLCIHKWNFCVEGQRKQMHIKHANVIFACKKSFLEK